MIRETQSVLHGRMELGYAGALRPCCMMTPRIEPVGRHFRGGANQRDNKKGWEPNHFGFPPPPVNINVSAVDFHFHHPFHVCLALELLHLLGILAAQLLDLLIIRLDAVEDGFGTQVIPAQRAGACAHRAQTVNVQLGTAILAGDVLALAASPSMRISDEGFTLLCCLVLPTLDGIHRGSRLQGINIIEQHGMVIIEALVHPPDGVFRILTACIHRVLMPCPVSVQGAVIHVDVPDVAVLAVLAQLSTASSIFLRGVLRSKTM